MKPTIKEVAIEKLDLSLSEMRIINPHWVAKIQSSMWVHGQLQPVVVRSYKDKYQVIDDDYKYALVAGESLKYLWILSRETNIPEDIKNKYLKIAEDMGYNTSDLLWVKHDRQK